MRATDREETEFADLAAKTLSRREVLGTGAAFGATAFIIGTAGLIPASAERANRLTFEAVAANSRDTITVPKGYNWQIVVSWGDPLWSDGPPFDPATRGTAASQERAFGDNTDGMSLFRQGDRNVLAVNNEFVNLRHFFGNRPSARPESADDIHKGKAAHGVSIFEIAQNDGEWRTVLDSPFNRRITPDTPMDITGPARAHALMKTAADPHGTRVRGTFNNCGNGRTPWGTYLTCEENFNAYFSSADDDYEPSAALKRYSVGHKDRGHDWARVDPRFDISKEPNEPNRHGYIVEIDPLEPSATPKKRTALGRLKHENAEVVLSPDGRVVVYMGDDERGEYLYRFVSNQRYTEGTNGAGLLDDGILSVAKFHDDGTGEWLELTPETTGMADAAEICIHTRLAASAVRATTMDRPEWVAANPLRPEAYCCLTNNRNRGRKPNKGGDPTPVGGPNPRKSNIYGQIVRWRPAGGDHAAAGFDWDLFVVAGNPVIHEDARAGSANVTPDNMFNSPDGISFDRNGLLWIQTDGRYANTGNYIGHGNNQMLVGDPATGEIRRFLVGPKECEVTGVAWSPDRRTLFIGIQHPGEKGNSHFPGGGDTVPRSSIVAISRDDGGVIG